MGESKRKKKSGGSAPEQAPASGAPMDVEAAAAGGALAGPETVAAGGAGASPAAAPAGEGAAAQASAGDGLPGAGTSEGPPALPPLSTAALPLLSLEGQWLGAFLECCFADKRLVSLCHELKIITPGYRIEALPPEQVARVLADEYLAAEDVRAPLETAVREALRRPLFEGRGLAGHDLGEALQDAIDVLSGGDLLQHLARIAWAGLLGASKEHPEPGEAALDAIDTGLQLLEHPANRKAQQKPKDLKEAEKMAQAARQQAAKDVESARKELKKAEREAESLRAQLEQARAALSQREQKLAEERGELERVRAESVRLSGEVSRLTGEGAGRALSDARRAEAEARSLAERLQKSEEARALAEEKAAALERDLTSAGARAAAPVQAASDDLPTEEETANFLVPVLTREFYDSIDRWSRRMQRAAFDKIHRLANDWRHGSLRALALEGVPGYYRIRVATDVRLIYRRDGNQLEILSLIDREDLDRYIRQARTRPG
jgi:hypothetical protein